MKNGFFVLALLLLTACSHTSENNKKPLQFTVQKYQSFPGKLIRLNLPFKGDLEAGELYCRDKKIPFLIQNNHLKAYVPESYYSKLRPYQCYFTHANLKKDQKLTVAEIQVRKKKYPSSILRVDGSKVKLSKKAQKRVEKEWLMLKDIYESSAASLLYQGPFALPLDTKITSIYGTRRVYNKTLKGYHSGVDFRASTGTPIPVSNAGRVVYAGDLFYTGNTVIVDHGLGLFTLYCHLSKLKVGQGDSIKRGDIVGLAGATGRVTGPHLHWGVKVHGVLIDGMDLVGKKL